jgi:RHS repeat-associated protein
MTYDGLSSSKIEYDRGGTPGSGVISGTTGFTKDGLGALLTVTQPAGANASYTYNGLGKMVSAWLTSVSGTQKRSFLYDGLGHLTEFTQPETGRWYNYTYDAIGNVMGYTDGAGRAFTQSYDYKGRLTSMVQGTLTLVTNSYDNGTTSPASPYRGVLSSSIQRQMDASSTLQTVTTAYGYRAYDGLLGSVSQTVSAYGSLPPTLAVTAIDYDAMKQVISQTLPSSNTITQTYTHGAMATRSLSGTQLMAMAYTQAGALSALTFNNGFAQKVEYDAFNRPKGFQFERNLAAIWKNGSYASTSFPYQYDGLGNITSIGNMMTSTAPDTFQYDALSRLTNAFVHQSTYGHTYSYGYDGHGNLTSRSESVPAGYSSLKVYIQATGAVPAAADGYINALAFSAQVGTDPVLGPTNRITSVTRGGGTTGETLVTVAPVYDANGNTTDDGTFTYTYDPLNRQVAVRKKATAQLLFQHFYDAAGERAGTIAYTSGTATGFTQYLRDGSQVVFEKSWTISGTTRTPLSEKVYIGAGALTAMTRQTTGGVTSTSYYGTDHLGTVRATVTVNTTGTETTRSLHDFEPFGVEIVPLSASSNTHRYTGQERDVLDATSNTTVDYMHFRTMGVGLGRFMRPDNINGSPGNPQSWNLYAYVRGNPINGNDPTGHDTVLPGQTYTVSDPANSTAARSTTVVENGNVTTINTIQVQLLAYASGNYTKTTTTQKTTITKTADGQEHSFTGKAQQTVETGKSEALGQMVQGNQAVANQDLNGAGQHQVASPGAMIGAATGGSVVSSVEIRGITGATQAAFNAMRPNTTNDIRLKERVHWFGVGVTIGAGVLTPFVGATGAAYWASLALAEGSAVPAAVDTYEELRKW